MGIKMVGRSSSWFTERDGGFSSLGVVIALTLTIALVFTSAQIYWINSTSGDIQFAADAGALAAENVVAEYYVIARVADAVVLSFSLFGLIIYGIAIVVSCIPYCQSVGAKLMSFGEKVFSARDDIATQAQKMLAKLQKALPFLAAVNASTVVSSNKFSPSGQATYQGLAILVPLQGKTDTFADDSAAQEVTDSIEKKNQETGELTDAAENKREEMNQAKLQGYLADCGNEPNYCMYERSHNLAGLHGASNPNFSNIELWKFDYALNRAKAYYQQRAQIETPKDNTLQERIDSQVRKNFYDYAVSELANGYAHTDVDGVLDAYFPLLASNYEEIRTCRLYTDDIFPVDGDGCMHGVSNCPGISGGIVGWGSISDLESGVYTSCASCDIGMKTIGHIASASSNIDNGFEYHYRIVAGAADRYSKSSKEFKNLTNEAKGSAGEAFDSFGEALEALKSQRLDPSPPGRNGCIVFAFDLSNHAVPLSISNSFVQSSSSLSPRVAISAAALVEDEATEGNTVLSSFLDSVQGQEADLSVIDAGLGVFDGILGVWGDVLLSYSRGADSLSWRLGDFLRSIPIISATPLASWAQDTLQETIEVFGLQGVNLSAPKPVIVNSIHVLNAGDSNALAKIVDAKQAYSSIPGSGSGTISDAIVDGILVEVETQASDLLDSEFTIFTISFGDFAGAPSIPIKVKLPAGVANHGKALLSEGLDSVGSLFGGASYEDYWQ